MWPAYKFSSNLTECTVFAHYSKIGSELTT